MNNNSKAILVLCSFIGAKKQNVSPLQPKEWGELATKLISEGYEPYQLLEMNDEIISKLHLSDKMAERIMALVERSSALTFEIARYNNLGIRCVTRADKEYPAILKKRLGITCPPVIYYCGDLSLIERKYVGFVGSREINKQDIEITHKLIDKCLINGYGIVSGGAKGVDSEAYAYCIDNEGFCLEILADSMEKKIKNKDYIENIRNKKLLSISLAAPDAGFDVGMAMMRNKFIYLFSSGTIVIKASYNEGGTWSGATECIRKGYSPVCTVNNKQKGNMELAKLGAKLIDEKWDGTFEKIEINNIKKKQTADSSVEQLSLF